jgi:23S rRNA (cytosine1962-C5)-methyltransferase
MFRKDQYQLLDFGNGRRLERFGQFILNRPCPAAEGIAPAHPEIWRKADAEYVRREPEGGNWRSKQPMPLSWSINYGKLQFELKLTDFGHVGIFPEQGVNWDWISRQVKSAPQPVKVLNLFAYTGGATMALARAGCKVTHVDASKPALAWARENAAANALSADAVRWIQDDAATFVRRELRRGRRYDAAIMDPPAFGRTPDGRVWKLTDQFGTLLADVVSLLENPVFLLINDYTRDADPAALAHLVESALSAGASTRPPQPHSIEAGHLHLRTTAGRQLDTGVFVRWKAE